MGKYLRPLALVNVAVAVVFLIPAVFLAVVENVPRSDVRFAVTKFDTSAQSLAEIQSTTDIEKLRHRAKVLTEVRDFDNRVREADSNAIKRFAEWFWMLMAFSGIAFLLNAVTIWSAASNRQ